VKLLQQKSWRIVFMFVAISALLVWLSAPVVTRTDQQTPEPFESTVSAYEVLHHFEADLGAFHDNMATVTDSGTINLIFGDEESLSGDGYLGAFFTNLDGEMMQIATGTPSDFLAFNGDTVTIDYLADSEVASDDTNLRLIMVTDLRVVQNDTIDSLGVTGNTRWVNVACRFADMSDVTPQPMSYFETILDNDAPGMDDYWRTTSAQLVNIDGSSAYGWYDLPRTKAEYSRMGAGNVGNALRALMTDCTNAAIEAEGVDFTQFGGINMMLNDTFGCCAWGGSMPLKFNGRTAQYRTTWLPPWAFNSLHVIAHEMGHGWGLPHSSGPYGKVYDSAWDVMSGGNSNHTDAICRVGSDPLGCWQVGTIGLHLGILGWIPEDRMVVVADGQSATITINSLTTLGANDDNLLILVPINNGNTFYTVEARAFIDYDRNLPGEAVVLHQVVPGRSSPAHVVDADNNGNPNDAGAMWLPGETFSDNRANITVSVVSRDGSSFTVEVSNND